MSHAAWFADARFGLFIHWGLYAVRSSLAGKEWAIYREQIDRETYDNYRNYFDGDRFDADDWVRQAREAGMRYVVLTAKHHDGFCLFDTATTGFNSLHTPLGRDVVREVADACRRAGLRFGVYFSVWDLWHEGLNGGGKYNFNAEGQLRGNEAAWTPSDEGIDLMHRQVEELLTNYGRIDVLWFDVKRAPAAAYRGHELLRRARELQPGILVNDRLVSPAEATDAASTPDLVTPENKIPATGLVGDDGTPLRWESCMCLNGTWGYIRDDQGFKGGRDVLDMLADVCGKGGNLLLNVGPDARGRFPAAFAKVFADTAGWLDLNGRTIYGTRPFRHPSNGNETWHPWFLENFQWKCSYVRGDDDRRVFLHVHRVGEDRRLVVPRLDGRRVRFARGVDDGSEVPVERGNYLTREPTEHTLRLPRHLNALGPTTIELFLEDA